VKDDRTMFEAMQDLLVGLLVFSSPAVLLIAARLWRARRLSDRAMTNLVIALVPALVFAYGLISGYSPPLILATTGLVIAPGLLLRPVIFDLIREQGALQRGRGDG
jgi:hypothetical protein